MLACRKEGFITILWIFRGSTETISRNSVRVHVYTSLIWKQPVVSLHHSLVSQVGMLYGRFLLLDLLQAWFSFLLFHSLESEVFCAWVMPDFGWCVQMGCVSNCGLKSSYRLPLIPQP